MHCGGELSSLAKLAIFVPPSLPRQRGDALCSRSVMCAGGFSPLSPEQMSGCLLESKQIPTKSAEVGQRELMHEYDREASLL